MLRSIIAVAAGVVIGIATIILFEPVIHRLMLGAPSGPEGSPSIPARIGAGLYVPAPWFAAAFGGGVVASLIARRWAPAVWVVAATILLLASLNSSHFSYSAWVAAAIYLAIVAGGFLAIKATKAVYGRPPVTAAKERT